MDIPEQPQTYLILPPAFELGSFSQLLARMLDTHQVACLRLALATQDENTINRSADLCRELAHARDVPLVIQDHLTVVERLGLDGVHFSDTRRSVRDARKELGPDAIVGTFCGTSRHAGLEIGEAGADYVSFGPVGDSGLSDERADTALFSWWSEMIELPVVAEGALDADIVRTIAPMTDFFAYGEEIWRQDDPVAALGELLAAIE